MPNVSRLFLLFSFVLQQQIKHINDVWTVVIKYVKTISSNTLLALEYRPQCAVKMFCYNADLTVLLFGCKSFYIFGAHHIKIHKIILFINIV